MSTYSSDHLKNIVTIASLTAQRIIPLIACCALAPAFVLQNAGFDGDLVFNCRLLSITFFTSAGSCFWECGWYCSTGVFQVSSGRYCQNSLFSALSTNVCGVGTFSSSTRGITYHLDAFEVLCIPFVSFFTFS